MREADIRHLTICRYVEPFSASASDPKHPMLVLVYRQQARIQAEEYQRGCSPSIVSDRFDI